MNQNHHLAIVEQSLLTADIRLNGSRPWDITVHDERLFPRIFSQGSLGLGESYMDGWWDCEAIDEMIAKILDAKLDKKIKRRWKNALLTWQAKFFNSQSIRRAWHIGRKHYDIGNDLYECMLGSNLTYTCGYWKQAHNLEDAQAAKLDIVCRKIGLKPGQTVLDIGCGWGSFAKFAAERYGAQVVGVTVSKNQSEFAREHCHGLPVEILLEDYRKITGVFDHIISLGMFEHVCPKNYRLYMQLAHKHLKDDGLFLLHTIGSNHSDVRTEPWLEKYIFPGSVLPSVAQIGRAIEGLFIMEDWHNFGADYDKTLVSWFKNFNASWPEIKNKYSNRFYRMWKYYLLSCAGTFRSRQNQLWQIVLSKHGVAGGYSSIR